VSVGTAAALGLAHALVGATLAVAGYRAVEAQRATLPAVGAVVASALLVEVLVAATLVGGLAPAGLGAAAGVGAVVVLFEPETGSETDIIQQIEP
jgi:hypothetical protein